MSYHTHVPPLIRQPSALKTSIRTSEFKTALVAALRTLEKPEQILSNVAVVQSFVKYAAVYLENIVKKAQKIDKLALLIDVFRTVCPDFNDTHRTLIAGMVEFMLSNGDIRKKPIKFFTRRVLAGLKVIAFPAARS